MVWLSTEVRARLEVATWDVSPLGNIAWVCAGLPTIIVAISFARHFFTFPQRSDKDEANKDSPHRAKPDENKADKANADKAKPDENKADKANADKAKPGKDKAWLQTDMPITDSKDDRFVFGDMARRIGDRLLKEPPPAQAILGRLGSGKTSLRNLTQQYVASTKHPRRIEFVNIELWPYETPDAAVQGILRLLTKSLSKEIGTMRLDGLPNAYLDAITRASGLTTIFPQAASRARTPDSVLSEIDAMAKIIDRRYVLWVEDLERFAFGDPAAEQIDASEFSRLAPIRALLVGLDNAESFTVITATTTLFQRFDLEKMARYVERIPDLPRETIRQEIAKFRAERLKAFIDPAAAERNALGWHPQYDNGPYVKQTLGDAIVTFAGAMAALANTPRVLKQALRRADETWTALPGEIDIDEMIAMCLLREASPQGFALIENHVDRFRGLAVSTRRDAQPVNVFVAELAKLLSDPIACEAIEMIVSVVFDKNSRRPQGLRHAHHVDYWQRFLVLPKIEDKLRDQYVLASIAYQKNDEILELLADPMAANAVQDFSNMFVAKHLQTLFSNYVKSHLDDDPGTWPRAYSGRHAPGMENLCNSIQNRWLTLNTDELARDVQRGIELAAPKNLALMNQIEGWMLSNAVGVNQFEPSTVARLTTLVRSLLYEHYVDDPKALQTALQNVDPIVLSQLCWGIPHQRGSLINGLPFPDWPAFARTVSDALDADPEQMSQQIVWMIAERHGGSEKWTLNLDRCRALFENPADLVQRMTGIAFENADELAANSPTVVGAFTVPNNSAGLAPQVRPGLTQSSLAQHGYAQNARAVEGFWFTHRNEFQGERPTYEATGAILVEDGLSLAAKTTCLDLEPNGSQWIPVSETASSELSHWKAIAENRECFFVPFDTWPRAYAATANGTVTHHESSRRFLPEIVALAAPDKPLVLLTLTELSAVDTSNVSAAPSDEAAPA